MTGTDTSCVRGSAGKLQQDRSMLVPGFLYFQRHGVKIDVVFLPIFVGSDDVTLFGNRTGNRVVVADDARARLHPLELRNEAFVHLRKQIASNHAGRRKIDGKNILLFDFHKMTDLGFPHILQRFGYAIVVDFVAGRLAAIFLGGTDDDPSIAGTQVV